MPLQEEARQGQGGGPAYPAPLGPEGSWGVDERELDRIPAAMPSLRPVIHLHAFEPSSVLQLASEPAVFSWHRRLVKQGSCAVHRSRGCRVRHVGMRDESVANDLPCVESGPAGSERRGSIGRLVGRPIGVNGRLLEKFGVVW